MTRPKFRRYLTYADALEYVFWIHDMADVSEGRTADVLSMTPDPDDDYLVGLSILGEADALVSGDAHLLDLGAIRTIGGETTIGILTPRQFLDKL